MLNHFLPSAYVKSVFLIKPEDLLENGIKGIITDLDNTLVEWDRADATQDIMAWFKSMRDAGLQITVVSNNHIERVSHFCDPLGIPYICEARKPTEKVILSGTCYIRLAKKRSRHDWRSIVNGCLGCESCGAADDISRPCSKFRCDDYEVQPCD